MRCDNFLSCCGREWILSTLGSCGFFPQDAASMSILFEERYAEKGWGGRTGRYGTVRSGLDPFYSRVLCILSYSFHKMLQDSTSSLACGAMSGVDSFYPRVLWIFSTRCCKILYPAWHVWGNVGSGFFLPSGLVDSFHKMLQACHVGKDSIPHMAYRKLDWSWRRCWCRFILFGSHRVHAQLCCPHFLHFNNDVASGCSWLKRQLYALVRPGPSS